MNAADEPPLAPPPLPPAPPRWVVRAAYVVFGGRDEVGWDPMETGPGGRAVALAVVGALLLLAAVPLIWRLVGRTASLWTAGVGLALVISVYRLGQWLRDRGVVAWGPPERRP